MELKDFRISLINDIKAKSNEESIHQNDAFVKEVKDILVNDFNLTPDLTECYVEQDRDSVIKKKFKIDAGFFEIPTNTLHLLIVDFDDSEEPQNITAEEYKKSSELMISYLENFVLNKQYNMLNVEDSQPHVQLAVEIRQNLKDLYTVQLYYVSTNPISKTIKNIQLDDLVKDGARYKVKLEVIDIQKIFNSEAADFKKEPVEIDTIKYGIEGIQAIKANVESNEYDAYLAVVPGDFLSEIYKDLGPRLLEANVRSFLNTTGSVNKGIARTLANDPNKFFAYNNGISTTAKAVEFKQTNNGLLLTKLIDFQIINGGQTTASLASSSIRDKNPLKNVFVQMKLTILKKENPDLIRSIARFANSQNKVTTADLSSNLEYFVRIEEFSRKIYTPPTGLPYQTRWFFERARGQYKQSLMKMTPSEANIFERTNPNNQKFSKTDLAKFDSSYNLKPFDVAWGSEVNASRFVEEIELMWDDDQTQFNEYYFKTLIAKAILFKSVEKVISNQEWYIEKKGYRAEMVGYVISKIVFDTQNKNKKLDLLEIWKNQKTDESLESHIEIVSKLVFDHFYNEKRPVANIREYAKKEICWSKLKDLTVDYDNSFIEALLNLDDDKAIQKNAKKTQKDSNDLQEEIEIYKLGKEYWNSLLKSGLEKRALNEKDISLLNSTIKYCSNSSIKYSNLMAKYVIKLRKKLVDSGLVNG
jgi:hypothetical protein